MSLPFTELAGRAEDWASKELRELASIIFHMDSLNCRAGLLVHNMSFESPEALVIMDRIAKLSKLIGEIQSSITMEGLIYSPHRPPPLPPPSRAHIEI